MKEIKITMPRARNAAKGSWWILPFSIISFFTAAEGIFLLFVRATGMQFHISQTVWMALALTVLLRLIFLKPAVSRAVFPFGLALLAIFGWYQREKLFQGFLQIADSVIARVNEYYVTDFAVFAPGKDEESVILFFQFTAVLLFFLIAFEMYHRMKILLPSLLMILLVVGALAIDIRPEPLSLFGSTFGLFMGRAMDAKRRKNAGLNIQAKAGMLMGFAAAAAIAFSYFAAGPALHGLFMKKFDSVKRFQVQAEDYMEQAVKDLSSMEGGFSFFGMLQSGGTMVSGKLTNTFEGNTNGEAMRISIDVSPAELGGMIYLRGFTGNRYRGNSWGEVDDRKFERELAEWSKDSFGAYTVADLPYKSAAEYALTEGDVRRIHYNLTVRSADDRYAYLPYQAEASGSLGFEGDGAILLGSARREYHGYLGIPEGVTRQTMTAEEEQFLREYESYVQREYLDVPEGLDRLEELSRQLSGGTRTDIATATERIRRYLQDNCSYSLQIDPLPNGKDFTEYFLFEQKEGFCTHFASTGLLLYRMMGIPARYVTGYAVRPESFYRIEGGYETVVTGENAHAWIEVYVNGYGWKPVEMTPGYSSQSTETVQIPEDEGAYEQPQLQDTPQPTVTDTPVPTQAETKPQDTPELSTETDTNKVEKPAVLSPEIVRYLAAAGGCLLAAAALGGGILIRRTIKMRHFLKSVGYRVRRQAAVRMAKRCYEEYVYVNGEKRNFLRDDDFAEAFAQEYPELGEECRSLMDAAQRAYFGNEEISDEEYRTIRSGFEKIEQFLYQRCGRYRKILWVYQKCFGR